MSGFANGGVATEETAEVLLAIAGHDRFQHTVPIVGAVHVALAQQCPLKVAELVETEQWMIASAAKMSVVRRAFLSTVGLPERTIQIENQFANRLTFLDAINPVARQVDKGVDVMRSFSFHPLDSPLFWSQTPRTPPTNKCKRRIRI